MTAAASDEAELLVLAKAGDQQALAALFARYRDRLRALVRLRLDRRLAGRIDASDVLQDAYRDLARRFPETAGWVPVVVRKRRDRATLKVEEPTIIKTILASLLPLRGRTQGPRRQGDRRARLELGRLEDRRVLTGLVVVTTDIQDYNADGTADSIS